MSGEYSWLAGCFSYYLHFWLFLMIFFTRLYWVDWRFYYFMCLDIFWDIQSFYLLHHSRNNKTLTYLFTFLFRLFYIINTNFSAALPKPINNILSATILLHLNSWLWPIFKILSWNVYLNLLKRSKDDIENKNKNKPV